MVAADRPDGALGAATDGGRKPGELRCGMGIETILIVLGVAVLIAVAVGVNRAKRKAGSQAPKPQNRSDVGRA